jgi:hypothetical protein
MDSLQQRINKIDKYEIYNLQKKDGENICPDEFNVLDHNILLIKNIGTPSINGEVVKSCIPFSKNEKCEDLLATKKIPLTNFQKTNFQYHDNKTFLTKHNEEAFNELIILKLCKYVLLNNNSCPNLPLYYKYYKCDSCIYKNEEILNKYNNAKENLNDLIKYLDINHKKKHELNNMINNYNDKNNDNNDITKLKQKIKKLGIKKKSIFNYLDILHDNTITKSCILVVNEFADEGDLVNWLKTKRSVKEWLVMYFQVFAGLYTLQKYFDMTHHDLHWGNVLVLKINKGGYLYYKIDNIYYKIPNIGFLFVLWDFGYATIPNKIEPPTYDSSEKDYRYCLDYYRILHAIHWNNEDNKTTPKIMLDFFKIGRKMYEYKIPLKYIFKKLFNVFITDKKKISQKDIVNIIRIDDDNQPFVPKKYEWLLNTNNNYINL